VLQSERVEEEGGDHESTDKFLALIIEVEVELELEIRQWHRGSAEKQ
jgi:hypothetical protein